MDARIEPGQVTSLSRKQARPIVFGMLLPVFMGSLDNTAGASGPALGGFLSDHLHWSAIFWLNIGLGIAAAAVTTILWRRLPRHERPHRLDVIGALLIGCASVSFMLALNLGGRSYAW